MKPEKQGCWDRVFSKGAAQAVFAASVLYLLAIAVSSLLKGGPWLAYETPILGPPWSIPFEFPLYQWLVALTAKSGLFAVDQAGSFVSELFFFLSLYPLFKILGFLNISPRQRHIILALFCLSPQYLFWSRSPSRR